MANFFKKYLPAIAGAAAGGISNQFSALKPFSAAISAGAGALTNKKSPLQGAAQGFVGGGVGSALAGGVGGMFGGTGSALDKFGSGAMSGLKTYGNSIPGFGGIGTSNPTGAMAKFLTPQSIQKQGVTSSVPGNARLGSSMTGSNVSPFNLFSGDMPAAKSTAAVGSPASTVVSPAAMKPKGLATKILGDGVNTGRFMAGAGATLLPNLFAKDVPASDFSPVTNPMRDRILNASPERQLAIDTYSKTITQPNLNVEPALANIKLLSDRQRAENLKGINQQFAAMMPGGNYANNSAYQDTVTKMNAQMDQQYAAQVAQTQMEYDMQRQVQQQAAAAALAELDQAQIQSLMNLAQYDIYTIAEKTGHDLQQAQQIKELGSTIGTMLMKSSLPNQEVTAPTINLNMGAQVPVAAPAPAPIEIPPMATPPINMAGGLPMIGGF